MINVYPTFEPWENYSYEQLASIVKGWQFIVNQSGWRPWHEYGQKCIAEIEAEIEKRSCEDIPFE
ncbi:hypothetical protein [Leptolyngbya sp. NIES-2104]|uniref:hypothetical protein n=1 Tax=Leptolyngbya sp. NIES-2104 TaxID=1552121 RepID=UPI0006EC9E5E|nr:hypothetical protein [Leptolyngbya sp. NIES-2104]GAP99130.1 hypothetical protein NIES2104_56880 [Leptolyngbya sp. NIES-2104]